VVRRRGVWAACCFCLGLLAAGWLGIPSAAWFGSAAAGALAALLTRGWACRVALSLSVALGAGGWYAARACETPEDSLARRLSPEPQILCVEGVVAEPPRIVPAARGTMGGFLPRRPVTRFPFEAQRIVDAGEAAGIAQGRLYVTVAGAARSIRAGDRVRITGLAEAPAPPTNPGERDVRPIFRARGIAGFMHVDTPELIEPARSPPTWRESAARRLVIAVARLERNARSWLESPSDDDAETRASVDRESRALLLALLLGQREPELRDLSEAMTRLGLTHVLAISGLNLAILAGTVLLIVRSLGAGPRVEALVAGAAIIVYLLVLPAQAPVVRAALGTLVFLIAEVFGRRYDRLNLLGWTAIAVLLWRPTDLWDPGFQLSFGVVGALLTLATPVRVKIFGPRPERDTIGSLRAGFEMLKDAAAASLVAWAVASPLIADRIGIFSPLGPIATLILAPFVGLLMSAGYLVLVIAAVVPEAGVLVAGVLAWLAELTARVVFVIDTAPWSAVYLPRMGTLWTVITTAVVIWWLMPRGQRNPLWPRDTASAPRLGPGKLEGLARLGATAIASAFSIWLLVLPGRAGDASLRLDSVDVGDGSCHLLRSGGEAMLYDCGSLRTTAGEYLVPQALRALGAWQIPVAVVSHANLDHFDALPDIADRIRLRTLYIGEAFALDAEARPRGSPAFLLAEIRRRGVEVRLLAQGDRLTLGDTRIEVISPPRGAEWAAGNDASLVLLASAPDRARRNLLLLGDVGRPAASWLIEQRPGLRADVCEAPHHGSGGNPEAIHLLERLNPRVVVQSTGPSRLDDPRWDDVRSATSWFATAADGAVSVVISHDGSIHIKTWRPGGSWRSIESP